MGQKSLGIGLPRALNRKTQTRSLRILAHHQRGIGYIQCSLQGQATGSTDSFGGSGKGFPESPLLLASSRIGRERHKAYSGEHDGLLLPSVRARNFPRHHHVSPHSCVSTRNNPGKIQGRAREGIGFFPVRLRSGSPVKLSRTTEQRITRENFTGAGGESGSGAVAKSDKRRRTPPR